jgi:hypothetical protein
MLFVMIDKGAPCDPHQNWTSISLSLRDALILISGTFISRASMRGEELISRHDIC